eukprot:TRINITY_DN555_c0_g1_i13.p1 TRINITY_DN555_c0_g1~~TRINITY_DN555_c0_g1_i13.p1  ORF type:complete len:551 (-),score=59.14 TRINITY_DN555_c0_g1_i13:1525-3177(-)
MESQHEFQPTSTSQFVCVCLSKVGNLQSESSEQGSNSTSSNASCASSSVRSVLEQIGFDGQPSMAHTIQGGGIVTPVGPDSPSVYQGESLLTNLLAAFAGRLENYSYLVKKYCPELLNVRDPQKLRLEEIRQRHPVSEAHLLCILYYQLGTNMVPKLRGRFAFVLYNARQIRVLAANDSRGTFKLQQAFMPDGSLIVSCGDCMPPCAQECTAIEPGCMKYGWHAPPKKYSSTEDDRKNAAKEARDAAASALCGIGPLAAPKGPAPGKGKMLLGQQEDSEKKNNQGKLYFPVYRTRTEDSQVISLPNFRRDSWSADSQTSSQSTLSGNIVWSTGGLPALHPVQSTKLDPYDWRLNQATAFGVNHPSTMPHSPSSQTQVFSESMTALSALPKALLDNLAGSDTNDPACLGLVTDLLINSTTSILITDALLQDNPIIYANPAFISFTGYGLTTIIGKNPRFLQSPPGEIRAPSFTSMMVRKNIDSGASDSIRILNYTSQGEAVWNDMTLTPVYDQCGLLTHWLGILDFSFPVDIPQVKGTREVLKLPLNSSIV